MKEKTETIIAGLWRLILLVAAIALGCFVGHSAHRFWGEDWVAHDGQLTKALVLQAHPKRVFDYRYTVAGKDYVGSGSRDWEDEKDHAVQVGESCPAFYSSSHPWLSSLRVESVWYVVGGAPFFAMFLLWEFALVAVIFDLRGKWVKRLGLA